MNGKNRTNMYESVDMNGIFCRDMCAQAVGNCTKESIKRKWSESVNWSELKLRKTPNSLEYDFGIP